MASRWNNESVCGWRKVIEKVKWGQEYEVFGVSTPWNLFLWSNLTAYTTVSQKWKDADVYLNDSRCVEVCAVEAD